jgi:hypothetical protein
MAVDAKSEQIISWFFKKRSGGGGFYRGWRMEGGGRDESGCVGWQERRAPEFSPEFGCSNWVMRFQFAGLKDVKS